MKKKLKPIVVWGVKCRDGKLHYHSVETKRGAVSDLNTLRRTAPHVCDPHRVVKLVEERR